MCVWLRLVFAVLIGHSEANGPEEEEDDDYGEDWEYGV